MRRVASSTTNDGQNQLSDSVQKIHYAFPAPSALEMRVAILVSSTIQLESAEELGPQRTIRGFSSAIASHGALETLALVISQRPRRRSDAYLGPLHLVRCWAGDAVSIIREFRPEILQTFS